MQNFAVPSRMAPKVNGRGAIPKTVSLEAPSCSRPPKASARSPYKLSARSPSKPPSNASANFAMLAKTTLGAGVSRTSSPALTMRRRGVSITSNTSLCSSRPEAGSEGPSPKLRHKFTQPRMNQLTEQRLKRQKSQAADAIAAAHANSRPRHKKVVKRSSRTSISLNGQPKDAELVPSPRCLEPLQNKLKDLQTEFLQMASNFRNQGADCTYKLVSLVQQETGKLLVHNDDLLGFPKNLPAQSVNDFKRRCAEIFDFGCSQMLQLLAKLPLAKDESAARKQREELRAKMKSGLSKMRDAVANEIGQLCSVASKTEATHLKSNNSKLGADLVEVRKNRDEMKKQLDTLQKRSNDLALELAEKNMKLIEQTGNMDNLRNEIKQLKKSNKVVQQQSKENEAMLEQLKQTIDNHVQRISKLEEQLKDTLADKLNLKKRVEKLTKEVAEKQQQICDLESSKEWHDESTEPTSNPDEPAVQISNLESQLEQTRRQLELQEESDKQLRSELEQKEELLCKAQQKELRLEEQIEHHRRVLNARTDRINYLDQEMKQREQENRRRLNDITCQACDKNTTITKISNQLASAQEQFHDLCSTLSVKQTKLHSQEHVIKLLEESNARSVQLHTRLGEKNARLKEELDHLRRAVNTLKLGSEGSDLDSLLD